MSRGPKISFIMPVRNCVGYLAQTFYSLLRQDLKNIEIIALDDASEDSSLDIIRHFSKKEKRVRAYAWEQHMGAAVLRNEGNKYALADIICVADAGDLYHYHRAKATYNYFKKHPKISLFSTGVEIIDDLDRHICYEFPKLLDKSRGIRPSISHPTVAYRKKLAETVKYNIDSKETDLYEIFLLDAINNGFKHGFINGIFTKKRMIYGRDMKEAWKTKIKRYKQYDIPIPKHAEVYANL